MFTESSGKKKHLLNVVLLRAVTVFLRVQGYKEETRDERREFKYRHTAVSVDPVEYAADDIIFRNASPVSRCPLRRFKDSLRVFLLPGRIERHEIAALVEPDGNHRQTMVQGAGRHPEMRPLGGIVPAFRLFQLGYHQQLQPQFAGALRGSLQVGYSGLGRRNSTSSTPETPMVQMWTGLPRREESRSLSSTGRGSSLTG